jgi:hypothetical protein
MNSRQGRAVLAAIAALLIAVALFSNAWWRGKLTGADRITASVGLLNASRCVDVGEGGCKSSSLMAINKTFGTFGIITLASTTVTVLLCLALCVLGWKGNPRELVVAKITLVLCAIGVIAVIGFVISKPKFAAIPVGYGLIASLLGLVVAAGRSVLGMNSHHVAAGPMVAALPYGYVPDSSMIPTFQPSEFSHPQQPFSPSQHGGFVAPPSPSYHPGPAYPPPAPPVYQPAQPYVSPPAFGNPPAQPPVYVVEPSNVVSATSAVVPPPPPPRPVADLIATPAPYNPRTVIPVPSLAPAMPVRSLPPVVRSKPDLTKPPPRRVISDVNDAAFNTVAMAPFVEPVNSATKRTIDAKPAMTPLEERTITTKPSSAPTLIRDAVAPESEPDERTISTTDTNINFTDDEHTAASSTMQPSPACPTCSSPMNWVQEHDRWFCKSCRTYY